MRSASERFFFFQITDTLKQILHLCITVTSLLCLHRLSLHYALPKVGEIFFFLLEYSNCASVPLSQLELLPYTLNVAVQSD